MLLFDQITDIQIEYFSCNKMADSNVYFYKPDKIADKYSSIVVTSKNSIISLFHNFLKWTYEMDFKTVSQPAYL